MTSYGSDLYIDIDDYGTGYVSRLVDAEIYSDRVTSFGYLSPGISSYWSFDEPDGVTAMNTAQAGLDAFLLGDTHRVEGIHGNALYFDGSGDSATTAKAFAPGMQGTVAFWFRPDDVSGGIQRIFGSDDAFELRYNAGTGQLFADVFASSSKFQSPVGVIDQGEWNQVIISWDYATRQSVMYVNGELVQNNYALDQNYFDYAGIESLSFGMRTGRNTEYYAGALDEFYIYDHVLTGLEVDDWLKDYAAYDAMRDWLQADFSGGLNTTVYSHEVEAMLDGYDPAAVLSRINIRITGSDDRAYEKLTATASGTAIAVDYDFRSGTLTLSGSDTVANYRKVLETVRYQSSEMNVNVPSDGLILYWDFENVEGTTIVDRTGNGYDGVMIGDGEIAEGPWGNAGLFDSTTDDRVEMYPDISELRDGTQDLTAAAWVRFDAHADWADKIFQIGGQGITIEAHDDPAHGVRISTHYKPLDGSWTELTSADTSSTMIADDGWHHVAVSYDDTDGTIRLYVDGRVVATQTDVGELHDPYSIIRLGGDTEEQFRRDMQGMVDEFRLYDTVLSDTQIAQLARPSASSALAFEITIIDVAEHPESVISYVNSSVTLDLNGRAAGYDWSTAFYKEDGRVHVVPEDVVLESQTGYLNAYRVRITNPVDPSHEFLSAETDGTSITAFYDAGSGVLRLAGHDSVENYQRVLASITYENTSDDIGGVDRVIEFSTGGDVYSNRAFATLSMRDENFTGERMIYMSFDESDGTVVSDEFGGVTATLRNGATLGAGQSGNALYLDAETKSYLLFDDPFVPGAQGSFSLWFQADSYVDGWAHLLGGNNTFDISYTEPDGGMRGNIGSPSDHSLYGSDATRIEPGDWHHLVATYDYDTGWTKLYIDGALYAYGASMTESMPEELTFSIGTIGGWTNLDTFDGRVDEFMFYNYALTDAEAYNLSQALPTDINLNPNNQNINFIENEGPVLVVDAATISDIDSANLRSLTVKIANMHDVGFESLSADVSGTNITADYDSQTGILTLSGKDTIANYQQVLRTVSYENTFVAPNLEDRIIEVQANDGQHLSEVAGSTIAIHNVNDLDTAQDDHYEVKINGVLDVDSEEGVLLNDMGVGRPDVEIDMTYAVHAMHGTVRMTDEGTFVYRPEQGYIGIDSFS